MLDMMRDVNTGIRWILHHTHFHGGDPNQVYLVGQSCGAQLAAMSIITQVSPSLTALPFPCMLIHWRVCQAMLGFRLPADAAVAPSNIMLWASSVSAASRH